MLSFGIRIHEEKKQQFVLDPTLEKEEGFQFQGMNRKNPLLECSANPMILILMRASLPSKIRKTTTNKKQRERQRNAHIHSHTIVLAYIRTNIVLW